METEIKIDGESVHLIKYKSFDAGGEKYVIFIDPDERDSIYLMKSTENGYEPVFEIGEEAGKMFAEAVLKYKSFEP